jgi:integrative and conjugative element protein (TIGR02256 family)
MCATRINRVKSKEICIFISNIVKDIFDKFRQYDADNLEACGILIGNHSIDGKQIKIKFATIPQPGDIRKKYSFKINTPMHQEILDQQFKLSKNEDIYLGTWHTHPEKNPMPSRVDIRDWEKQYHTNKHLFDRMIFGIIGVDTINFWIVDEETLYLLEKGSIYYE